MHPISKDELCLDRSEVLRYMGHGGDDPAMLRTAEDALARIREIMQPRVYSVRLPLDAMELPGKDIRRHLLGCDAMILLCATLGAAVDREIRRIGRSSMLEALALNAAAGEAIEKVCDMAEADLRKQEQEQGRYLTGRFSPGYGDLPMSIQPELLRLCDAPRKIGLTLTKSGILVPAKSVTAILGTSALPTEGRKKGCGSCNMAATCMLRKKGTTCEA